MTDVSAIHEHTSTPTRSGSGFRLDLDRPSIWIGMVAATRSGYVLGDTGRGPPRRWNRGQNFAGPASGKPTGVITDTCEVRGGCQAQPLPVKLSLLCLVLCRWGIRRAGRLSAPLSPCPLEPKEEIMRLWSLHPQYLDTAGLTACWREALLAQAALAGRTRGYTRHPQLNRFRESTDPLGAVAAFLDGIHAEATSRGFSYDATRIDEVARLTDHIDVTRGQLDYELEHLRRKLARRSPERLEQLPTSEPTPHPLFRVIDGPIADWEVR